MHKAFVVHAFGPAGKAAVVQADISKLENGNANPSLRTLQRLADGLGMRIKLEFVPSSN